MPTPTTLTGYQLADVLNRKLTDRGLKTIPSQMVYNYIRKGYIASVEVVEKGKTVRRVELDVAREYIKSYLAGERPSKVGKAELMALFED
jgi:hypothetical protein